MGRLEKTEKGAREAGVIDPDEAVDEIAIAQSAFPLGKGLTMPSVSPFTLLATSRKLYGVRRGQIGWGNIKEVVIELPIEQAQIEKKPGRQLFVGPPGRAEWVFTLIPYNNGSKKLLAYVKARTQVA